MSNCLKIFIMLTLLSKGFTLGNNDENHNIEFDAFLKKSSLEWARLTPALVVTLPSFRIIRNYNNTK